MLRMTTETESKFLGVQDGELMVRFRWRSVWKLFGFTFYRGDWQYPRDAEGDWLSDLKDATLEIAKQTQSSKCTKTTEEESSGERPK